MIRYSLLTNKGSKYSHNEDALFFANRAIQSNDYEETGIYKETPCFACVFDGVGGLEYGEVVSNKAAHKLEKIKDLTFKDRKDFIKLIDTLNKEVVKAQKALKEKDIMSTFVAVSVNRKMMRFANVGDSKAYLIRFDQIRPMSMDDTYENKLIHDGNLEELDQENISHVITNCLGLEDFDSYKSHYFQDVVYKGDTILIMSDGVSDYLDSKTLQNIVIDNPFESLTTVIKDYVDKSGARDNYSLIALRIE